MTNPTKIMFSGGGFFFWWQAGVLQRLQATAPQKIRQAHFYGCSAGAIIAALACCQVDIQKAKNEALKIAKDNNLWTSQTQMIFDISHCLESFLNILLPDNAAMMCKSKLTIYATKVDFWSCPIMTCSELHAFKTKDEIIQACLASVQIPFLLNGKATYPFLTKHYIDGSLFSPSMPDAITINHKNDNNMQKKKWYFLQNFTQHDFDEMIEFGWMYGDKMGSTFCFY